MKSVAEARAGKSLATYLKQELKAQGITYAELADLLRDYGFSETEASVTHKLSRGTLSAAFLVYAFLCMGRTRITFADDDEN